MQTAKAVLVNSIKEGKRRERLAQQWLEEERYLREAQACDFRPESMDVLEWRMACFIDRLQHEGEWESYLLTKGEACAGLDSDARLKALDKVRKQFGFAGAAESKRFQERQCFRRSRAFVEFMLLARARIEKLERIYYQKIGETWMGDEQSPATAASGDGEKKRKHQYFKKVRQTLTPHEVCKRIWNNLGRLRHEDPETGKMVISEIALRKVFRNCDLEQARFMLRVAATDETRFMYSILWPTYGKPEGSAKGLSNVPPSGPAPASRAVAVPAESPPPAVDEDEECAHFMTQHGLTEDTE